MSEVTIPRNDSIIELDANSPLRRDPFITSRAWLQMFFDPLANLLAAIVKVAKTTSSTVPLSASIATTSVYLTTRPGLYRVNYIVRVTQPATVNSSLQVTIGWLQGGVAQTRVGAVLNGNLTTTYETDSFIVQADGLTDITYAIAYASAGATAMQFSASVVVEALQQ